MFPDRSTYTGSWKLNADGVKMRHGRGVFDDGARQRYEGEWADDCMHGRGTFEYASGARYEGEFVANKYDGYGTFTFASGAFYEGTFKDNQFHGTGTFTDAQKTTWKGKVRRPAAHLPVSKRAVLASIHGFDSRARLPLRAVLQRNGSWFDARLRRRALERLCWLLRPEPHARVWWPHRRHARVSAGLSDEGRGCRGFYGRLAFCVADTDSAIAIGLRVQRMN